MSHHVQTIIDRCTRTALDGRRVTSWQNVANQLGWSVDRARGLYDPEYLRFYDGCSPSREPEPKPRAEDLIEPPPPEPDGPEAFKSPYVRKQPLKLRILLALKRQTMSAETVANQTETTVNSARATLSVLKMDALVRHSPSMPYTWSLTPKGIAEVGLTLIAVKSISAHEAGRPARRSEGGHGRANARVAGVRA